MSNEVTEFERKYEDLDDETLVSMLPDKVAERVSGIPETIVSMSDRELKLAFNIGETEEKLRIAFWLEYEVAKRTKKKMNISNVYGGTCTIKYFYSYIMADNGKLAYICRPPVEVQIALEELLLLGIEQMREVMALPNVNAKGHVDARLIDVKRKIFEDAANRRRGHVLRKTEVQTKSLNYNITGEMPKDTTPVDVDARLAEFEARTLPQPQQANDIISQVQVIDVESEAVKQECEGDS